MKRLILLCLMILPFVCFPQKYGVKIEPLCWTTGVTDSNVSRVVYISTRKSTPTVLYYMNAAGDTVSVSGGTLRFGSCACFASLPMGLQPFDNIIVQLAAYREPKQKVVIPRKRKKRA